jgi:hypothetical protein
MDYDFDYDDFDSVDWSEYFEEYHASDWDEDGES